MIRKHLHPAVNCLSSILRKRQAETSLNRLEQDYKRNHNSKSILP